MSDRPFPSFLRGLRQDPPPEWPTECDEPWRLFCEAVERAWPEFEALEIPVVEHNFFAALYFLRVLEASQAAGALARLGLGVDSEAHARIALEASFRFDAIVRDPVVVRLLERRESIETKRALREFLPGNVRTGLPRDLLVRIERTEAELEAELGDGVGDARVLALAIRAGREEDYQGSYRLLSSAVHSAPSSLMHLGSASDGFYWSPHFDRCWFVLLLSARLVATGIASLAVLTGAALPSWARVLTVQVDELREALMRRDLAGGT